MATLTPSELIRQYSSSSSADEATGYIGQDQNAFEEKYKHVKDPATGRFMPVNPCLRKKRLGQGTGLYRVETREVFNKNYKPSAGIHFESLYDEEVFIEGGGKDVPGVSSFEEMDLQPSLLENIRKLDYAKPLPIQGATYSLIKRGYDVVAHAQTGGGKTAAFMIPVVDWILKKKRETAAYFRTAPFCIVISPTRELAEQLYHSALEFTHNTNCHTYISMGDMSRAEDVIRLRRGCDIYFGTIGRICDFVSNNILDLSSVQFIVFDEADDHLGREDSFSEFSEIVVKKCRQNIKLQMLLFSATGTHEVDDFKRDFLRPCATVVTVGAPNTVNRHVQQYVIEVSESRKRFALITTLQKEFAKGGRPKVIVFTNTKRRSTVIACYLSYNGFKAYPVNGDLTTSLRHDAVTRFERDECSVIVATDVLSRGVDLKNVSLVINYDLPTIDKWAAYVHRIGRTARLGNNGKAITFYKSSDICMAHLLCQWLTNNQQEVPEFLIEDALTKFDADELAAKAREDYMKALTQSVFDSEEDSD